LRKRVLIVHDIQRWGIGPTYCTLTKCIICVRHCPVPNAFLLQCLHFPHFWAAFYHSADCDIHI